MFAKVTVVPPYELKADQVEPISVEYYSVTSGGESMLSFISMLTVDPASSALI